MEWLAWQGYDVFVPVGHTPDADLVALRGDEVLRVQVKTSTSFLRERWNVALCTRGGNRSWNGVVKRFSAERCDALFVHVGDGRRWLIPAGEVSGSSAILLGGPKYAGYEIRRGRALPSAVLT